MRFLAAILCLLCSPVSAGDVAIAFSPDGGATEAVVQSWRGPVTRRHRIVNLRFARPGISSRFSLKQASFRHDG